jgi:hypothetical protein
MFTEDPTGIFDQKWRYEVGWWQLSGFVPVTLPNDEHGHIVARSVTGLTTECGIEFHGSQWELQFVAPIEMCELCTSEVGFYECPDKCGDALCEGCDEDAYDHEYGLFCEAALDEIEAENE